MTAHDHGSKVVAALVALGVFVLMAPYLAGAAPWLLAAGGALVGAIFALRWRVMALRRQPPHFTIGKPGAPYMRRWYVIPRNRLGNIYLHHILRSDDDRALHDHPWVNLSWVLQGGYYEVTPLRPPTAARPVGSQIKTWRGRGSLVLRGARAAHRLELGAGGECWSLFFTGPNVRTWGFWCPQGWKPWQRFVDMGNTGEIGPGCGEA